MATTWARLPGHPVHKATNRSNAAEVTCGVWQTAVVVQFLGIWPDVEYVTHSLEAGNIQSSTSSFISPPLVSPLLHPISSFLSVVRNNTSSLVMARCPSSVV